MVSDLETKQRTRELDRILGQQYREDQNAIGMTYSEYKKKWQEALKLKQLKTRYSMYEPLPNESTIEFKKRLRTVTVLMPTETEEEFIKRVGTAFHK